MEVIGHQHPTDEHEFHLLPQLLERLDKTTAKTLGEEKGRPPIGTGGDEWQLSRAVSALVERHATGEYTLGESQTPKSRGLRQPAESNLSNLQLVIYLSLGPPHWPVACQETLECKTSVDG